MPYAFLRTPAEWRHPAGMGAGTSNVFDKEGHHEESDFDGGVIIRSQARP